MKHLFLVIIILGSLQLGNAQVKLGLMSGISPNHIDAGDFVVSTIDDSIKYSITNTVPSWHLGPHVRFQIENVFVKGAILGGLSYVYYDKTNFFNSEDNATGVRETEYQLDIPIDIGINFNRFFVNGGLIWSGHFIEEEQSILLSDTFSKLFEENKYTYKLGIGFDFDWQATLEVTYAFYDNFNSQIILDGNVDYNFNMQRHFLMVNFSWNFIRAGWD
jgi:hypothetical protein